jgi:hypothetical protein
MRTVKKFKMYALMTREPEEISQKCQRIWIQQAKSIFSVEKWDHLICQNPQLHASKFTYLACHVFVVRHANQGMMGIREAAACCRNFTASCQS